MTSFSDPAPLIGFLNRRRVAWVSSAHPRTLLVSSLRSIIRQKHNIHIMREVFAMLHYDGSENVYPSNTDKITPAALKLQTPMLKSKEIIAEVFRYLFNEDAVDADHLETCLVEFLKSADSKKIHLDASAYVVWTDLLIKQKKFFQARHIIVKCFMSDWCDVLVAAVVGWLEGCSDCGSLPSLGKFTLAWKVHRIGIGHVCTLRRPREQMERF